MSVKVTEAKKGMVIRYEGDLYQIVKYDHVTPGNWRAIHHLSLKNLKTGAQKALRMSTSDTIEPVFMEGRSCQYLYKDEIGHVFMDNETYEQFHLTADVLEDTLKFIVEGENVDVTFCEGAPVGIDLPPAMTLEVVEADAAVRGDTATNVQKNVTLNTGLVIKAPAHIKVGDRIKVKTDTCEFLGRDND